MACPSENDILKWEAVIFGYEKLFFLKKLLSPESTPWEGGSFQLTLTFTAEYPTKPPEVKFVTQIFHPNVYNDGRICLDILQD